MELANDKQMIHQYLKQSKTATHSQIYSPVLNKSVEHRQYIKLEH